MRKNMRHRVAALLGAFVLTGTFLLAGCNSKPQEVSPSQPENSAVEIKANDTFINLLQLPDDYKQPVLKPELVANIAEKYAINKDTVGWIKMNNTTIDDVVVYYDDSAAAKHNDYYLRRNFEGKYSFGGIYFADFRSKFDGTAAGLAQNTIIYGHSMDDNYNGTLLSQLKKYDPMLNPNAEEFAKSNPYIFFSVGKEDLAWEIFAVFDATIDFNYNTPSPTATEFSTMISESVKRSKFIYETKVTAEDKIITLSTCTYKYDKKYPNPYRYVIMAKLVSPEETLKTSAQLEVNKTPKAP